MRLMGRKWLIVYAVISIALFLVLSPVFDVPINKLLADLTQDLIVKKVNPIRKDYGVFGLEVDKKLKKAAQMKAKDMIERDYFDHIGPEGEKPWSWLDKVGYDYVAAGENLAMDFYNSQKLVEAWLNSPSHAKNILNSYFTDIGIGMAKGEMDGRETTVVVMFLAKERSKLVTPTNIEKDRTNDVVVDTSEESIEESIVKLTEQEDLFIEKDVPVPVESFEKEPETALVLSTAKKSKPVALQIFMLDQLPELARIFITFFYAFLILFTIIKVVVTNEKKSFPVLPSLFLILLIAFIWIP